MSDRRMQISSHTSWNFRRFNETKDYAIIQEFSLSLRSIFTEIQLFCVNSATIARNLHARQVRRLHNRRISAKAREFIPITVNLSRAAVSSVAVACFICDQEVSQIMVWRSKENFQTLIRTFFKPVAGSNGENFLPN